jgi:hypothetical protein
LDKLTLYSDNMPHPTVIPASGKKIIVKIPKDAVPQGQPAHPTVIPANAHVIAKERDLTDYGKLLRNRSD